MAYDARSSVVLASIDLALCWIFTSLRMYVRLGIQKCIWADDFFAIFGLLIFTVMNSAYMDALLNGGLTKHMSQIDDPTTAVRGLRNLFLCELFYGIGSAMIKISFTFTLLRVVGDKWHKWALYIMLALVSVFTVVYTFWVIFLCSPVDYAWNVAIRPGSGTCKDYSSMEIITYVHSAVMLIADFGLGLVLPILLLMPLQMKLRMKVTAGLTLGFASIASIATIVRFRYVFALDKDDLLYATNPLAFWSNIEFAWSIIATSAATLRPLLEKVGIKMHSSHQLSGTAKSTSNFQSRTRRSMRTTIAPGLQPDAVYGPRSKTHNDGESSIEDGWDASMERLAPGKGIEPEIIALGSVPSAR